MQEKEKYFFHKCLVLVQVGYKHILKALVEKMKAHIGYSIHKLLSYHSSKMKPFSYESDNTLIPLFCSIICI